MGDNYGKSSELFRNVSKMKQSLPEIISFYMGKNTRERRDYIMANLVAEVPV